MKNLLSKKDNYIIYLTIAFMLAIFAPLELYVSNLSEFWFSLDMFWWVLIVAFVCIFTFLVCIDVILSGIGISKYSRASFGAVAICLYIQGNFLNLRVGILNGGDISWRDNLTHIVVDTIVWIAIILVIFVCAIKWKSTVRILNVVCIFIFAVQLVTAFVLCGRYINKGRENTDASAFTDNGLYSTTTGDNVLIFILDMFDSTYFDAILEDSPDIKEELYGFTYYSNYAGVYSTTAYSLDLLSTGKMFYNEMPRLQWINEVANNKLYVDELLNNDYKLFYYWGMEGTIPTRLAKQAKNYYQGGYVINSYVDLSRYLYQIVACRYLPDGFKPLIWPNGDEFDSLKSCKDGNIYIGDNRRLRDGISNNPLVVDGDNNTIKYIYTNGSHYPYNIDAKGNDVLFGEISAHDQAKGALSIVLRYIDQLKKLGTYDNTSIIITADHGYYWDGTLSAPVMLVKPSNSNGELRISSVVTSQKDFASTVLDLSGVEYYSNYGESILEIDENEKHERLFYQYYLNEPNDNGNFRLIEYSIDNNGTTWEHYSLTDREISEEGIVSEHKKYCATCINGDEPVNDRDTPRLVHVRIDE